MTVRIAEISTKSGVPEKTVQIPVNTFADSAPGTAKIRSSFEGGLVVSDDQGRLYKFDLNPLNAKLNAYSGKVSWMQAHGGSVYIAGDNSVQRVPPLLSLVS